MQPRDQEPVTERYEPSRRLVDATDLARELAVFCDRAVRKMTLPPDLRRQPFMYMRYRRLAALVSAFDLGDIGDVLEGRFIAKRPIEAYASTIERIREHCGCPSDAQHVGHAQIELLYLDLLQFRADATVSPCSEGPLELGYAYAGYACWLSGEVVRPLHEQLARVDHALAEILDPQGRALDHDELVERYGFPDLDLSALI